jgi:hypothetical protein
MENGERQPGAGLYDYRGLSARELVVGSCNHTSGLTFT